MLSGQPAGRLRIIATTLAALALVFAGMPSRAVAQPAGPESVPADWHFRFDLFRMLLEQHGLEPVAKIDDVYADPQRSVVVILGELPPDRFWPEARKFARDGGRILVASDRNGGAEQWFQMNAGPVTTARRVFQHQGHNDCLQVVDLQSSHSLLAGVNGLVVNRSGWLSGLSWVHGDWEVIAQLPPLTAPAESGGAPLLAVSELSGASPGRAIVCADHSLFTNGMLWHGDNALLAVNVSQSLCDGDRGKLCFLLDGAPQGSYRDNLPLPSELPSPPAQPPPPRRPPVPPVQPELPLEQMIRLANVVVTKAEDSNLLNSAVIERPRNMPAAYFHRGLLLAAVLTALAVIVRALTNNNPTPAAATRVRPLESVSDRHARQRDTPEGRGTAARLLVRDLCRQLTSSNDPAVWKRDVTEESLTSKTRGLPVFVRGTIPLLLSLAFNSGTPHLSRTRFVDVGRAVEQLRQSVAGS